MREVREKKRRRMEEKCQQENLHYASISAKVDSLENRLTAKENESMNKIVYPTARKTIEVSSEISQSFAHLEIERKTFESNISGKLENIEIPN